MLSRTMLLSCAMVLAGCHPKNDCTDTLLFEKVRKATATEIAKCLIGVKNIDQQDEYGNSALSLALIRGDKEIFHQLIQTGANPFTNGPDQISLARLTRYNGNQQLLPELERYQHSYWQIKEDRFSKRHFINCIEHDNPKILQEFINQGFAVDSAVANGITPVALAALSGSTGVIDLLIRIGIDPDSEFDTRSILSIAAMFGYSDIIEILLHAGADIDNYDGTRTTALMFAVENNHLSVVEVLQRAGANTKMVDKNGETARDKAIKKDYGKVLELLLEGNGL